MNGDWQERSLYELADYQNGRAIRPEQVGPHGLPIVRIADLNAGLPANGDRLADDVDERHLIRQGDLLFAWSGSVGIYRWSGPHAVLNQHIFKVTARAGLDQRFLRYLLEAQIPLFKRVVADQATTMGHVKISDLKRIRVRVPPMGEQDKIGRVLGTLDDKIELNKRMNETLEQLARTLFAARFGEVVRTDAPPPGWTVARLGEHVEVVRGLSYTGRGLGSGLPLHNLDSVQEGGGYKREGIKYYSGEYRERHLVRPGDVIVANTEQGHDELLIGCPAIVPRRFGEIGLFSHHLYRVRSLPVSLVTPRFLHLLLAHERVRRLVAGFANGTTVNMLPLDGLLKPAIAIPPAPLIEEFDRAVAPLLERIEANEDENETLAAIRDTLLPKLISGELRVQDVGVAEDRAHVAAKAAE